MSESVVVRRVDTDMPLAQLGDVFARSGFFTDAREAAQAIVKIQAGRELGIGPVASMTSIFIVKGRVTLSANAVASQIRRSRPRYDYHVDELTDKACVLTFTGEGGEVLGVSKYTLEDAQKAGLARGDNWKEHPRNMLFSRAMTNGAKWFCPDVFCGPVYTPDELGMAIDAEGMALPQNHSTPHQPDAAPAESAASTASPVDQALADVGRQIEQNDAAPAAAAVNPRLAATIEKYNVAPDKQTAWVKALLDRNPQAVERAVVAIYHLQTEKADSVIGGRLRRLPFQHIQSPIVPALRTQRVLHSLGMIQKPPLFQRSIFLCRQRCGRPVGHPPILIARVVAPHEEFIQEASRREVAG